MIRIVDMEEERELLNSLRLLLAKYDGQDDDPELDKTLDFYIHNKVPYTCHIYEDSEGYPMGCIIFAPGIVGEMFVRPGWRGMGIGKSLLGPYPAPNVFATERSQGFYEKCGYEVHKTDFPPGHIWMKRV